MPIDVKRVLRARVGGPGRTPAGRRWRVLVPIVCLVAGIGFAASAHDSAGTDLRPPGTANLTDLVRTAETQVQRQTDNLRTLQQQVNALTASAGRGNSAVAAAQALLAPLLAPAGLTAVSGQGIVVVLDDAPAQPAGANVDPNQLVVHQSDLQAVVNAFWAGGAEAMTIAGQRVIATSAVRCVGNTLLLNGEVFSPPFRVAAIGPSRTIQDALNASPGVALFKQAAGYYGLGYTVEPNVRVSLPAYGGPPVLSYAKAVTK